MYINDQPRDTKFNFSPPIVRPIKFVPQLIPITCLIAYRRSIHKLNVAVRTRRLIKIMHKRPLHKSPHIRMDNNHLVEIQWERNGKVAVCKTYDRKRVKKKNSETFQRVERIYGFDEDNGRIKMIF